MARVRVRDADRVVLGAAVPAVLLLALRVWIAARLASGASVAELVRVTAGEAALWTGLACAGLLAARTVRPQRRMRVRIAYHVACGALFAASLVELVLFEVTGSRVDLDLVAFAVNEAPRVAPVVASEVHARHVVGLLAGLAILAMPALVGGTRRGAARRGRRIAVGLGVSALAFAAVPPPAAADPLAALAPTLPTRLWSDAVERFERPAAHVDEPAPTPLRARLPAGASRPPNVVIVVLESVGARATSLHTPGLDTTPALARMGREGLVVARAHAVVPHTSKSLVALLCGRTPALVTEMLEARPGGLPEDCLPALLEGLGYRTGFFQTAVETFERRVELIHRLGFDRFRARDSLARPGTRALNYFGLDDAAMVEPGVAWSAADPSRPFFAAYLTLASHHDYRVPEGWPRRVWPPVPNVTDAAARSRHLDAVAYGDHVLDALIAAYTRAGLAEDTLFVVVGDHGEAFGEHGRHQHDVVPWDEALHVPMVLWTPGDALGGRTGVVEGNRSHVDVLPTVLEAIGANGEGTTEGASLLHAVPADRRLRHACWRSRRCMVDRIGTDVVIDHYRERPAQRFDVSADPLQLRDVGDAPNDRVAAARAWRDAVNARWGAVAAAGRARLAVPDPSPAQTSFGDAVDALGCAADTPRVVPGESVWVSCRWRARTGPSGPSSLVGGRVSATLRLPALPMDARGPSVSANQPAGAVTEAGTHVVTDGALDLRAWPAGHAVLDAFAVAVPTGTPVGPARVEVRWTRTGPDPVAWPLDALVVPFEVVSGP